MRNTINKDVETHCNVSLPKRNPAFTLVELIVVITILAILRTIAFLSFQNISSSARDSSRLSDVTNIKKSLELGNATNGGFPMPDGPTQIVWSGSVAWYQGTLGDTAVQQLKKLSKAPIDPLLKSPYTYSVTASLKEYQIGYALENSVAMKTPIPNPFPYEEKGNRTEKVLGGSQNFFPLLVGEGLREGFVANADSSSLLGYTDGNYNGLMIKVSTGALDYYLAVPSIVTSDMTKTNLVNQTGSLVFRGKKSLPANTAQAFFGTNKTDTGVVFNPKNTGDFVIYSTGAGNSPDTVAFMTGFKNVYTGATITNLSDTNLTNSVNTLLNNTNSLASVLGKVGTAVNTTQIVADNTPSIPTNTITEATCTGASWEWVNSTNDMLIGSTAGNGFCISPTVNFSDTSDGLGGISFNGWGYNGGSVIFNGWDGTNNLSTTIRDSGEPNTGQYGQTKTLVRASGNGSYTCAAIGSATKGFTTGTTAGLTDGTDTLLNRMKYINANKNSQINMKHDKIDWVSFGANPPINNHAIPAQFLADCLDGTKDLGTDLTYKHSDNNTQIITYSQYATDVTANTDTASLSDTTYQNRQKYLLAWTQKSGSHLPSAYSSIQIGSAGTGLGEYQKSCEKRDGTVGTIAGTNDQSDAERIWLASIGSTDGSGWGRNIRIVGGNGCSSQDNYGSGYRYYTNSARFVVR